MAVDTFLRDFLIWRGDPIQVIVFCLFFFLLSILMSKLCCPRRKSDSIKLGDPRRGHRWYDVDFLHQPTYCSVCEQPTVSGRSCEACGLCICSDEDCIDKCIKEFACKVLALSPRPCMKHHWQRGNMPLCSNCFVCGEPCGAEPRLCDLRCIWCHRTAHETCLGSRTTRDCDLGAHRALIIPPYAVSLKVMGWRSGQQRIVINDLSAPENMAAVDTGAWQQQQQRWMPLLVLVNPRSGGNDGQILMRAFRSLLNPAQIFDLTEVGPESVLDLCRLLSTHRCRVLVCGGDGTVGWVLGSLDKLNLPLQPDIAICPLGTGNDLARVLGWGSGYTGEAPEDILHDVEHSRVTSLDRWRVSVGRPGILPMRRPLKTIMMNNYFGIGCDALVTLNFHKTRESRPDLFTNRIFNKAWYFGYGAKDVLQAACKNLHQKIEVEMDGVRVDLPELEGIIVTNINSWCGGCPIWTTQQILGSNSGNSSGTTGHQDHHPGCDDQSSTISPPMAATTRSSSTTTATTTTATTTTSSSSSSSSSPTHRLPSLQREQRTIGSVTPSSSVNAPSSNHDGNDNGGNSDDAIDDTGHCDHDGAVAATTTAAGTSGGVDDDSCDCVPDHEHQLPHRRHHNHHHARHLNLDQACGKSSSGRSTDHPCYKAKCSSSKPALSEHDADRHCSSSSTSDVSFSREGSSNQWHQWHEHGHQQQHQPQQHHRHHQDSSSADTTRHAASYCDDATPGIAAHNHASYAPSSFSDGKLEVMGLYSSLHIARLQISLADPLRLGQAKSVKITIKSSSPLPCQADGEPWEQGACVISITHAGQARMLSRNSPPN
eukprot:scpid74696/ scgid35178/ Diacylglycerol kinase epsilon; Diglyceride kinase epsilon